MNAFALNAADDQLPTGWLVVPLSELCSTIIDGTHFTPRYVESGVPFYSVENVTSDDFENTKFISIAEHEHLTRRCRPERGDILLTRIGSLGDTKLIDWKVDASIYVSLALLKLRDHVSSEYVYRYTKSQYFIRDVEKRSLLNAAPKKINMGEIGEVPVLVPPTIDEQNAIATALKDIDDLIASLDALIAKKRDIKQAAMQQLLTGKTRLPGFDGEWVSSTVGQVCDVKTGPFGAQLHESDYVNDGTPIITVEHLGEFGVQIDEDVPLVSDADRRRLGNYSLRLGDIVFSRVGSIDRNALIGAREEGWLFSGRLLRLRPEKTISSAFLSQIFHSDPFKELVRSVAVGQTMLSLNTKIVKALPILLPSKLEQDAIAQVFTDIDSDLALSEARIAKAKGLKQGMMQQLLTGRIRLV